MSQNPSELDRLIERCQMADEQAWAELFSEFGGQVARWLARLDYMIGEHDIPDLVDEVFVKVHAGLSRYSLERCPFRVWLYQQTENIAIDNRRKRTARKRIPPNVIVSIDEGPDDSGGVLELPAKGPSPDEVAGARDMHRRLFVALDALGPPESRARQLIGLVYFGGFTYHEVAETLQMKEKTVASALSRCMIDLRQIWAKLSAGEDLPPATND